MCARNEQTAIETSGADVLCSRKKLRKTLGGGISPLVRPRVKAIESNEKLSFLTGELGAIEIILSGTVLLKHYKPL